MGLIDNLFCKTFLELFASKNIISFLLVSNTKSCKFYNSSKYTASKFYSLFNISTYLKFDGFLISQIVRLKFSLKVTKLCKTELPNILIY